MGDQVAAQHLLVVAAAPAQPQRRVRPGAGSSEGLTQTLQVLPPSGGGGTPRRSLQTPHVITLAGGARDENVADQPPHSAVIGERRRPTER